jgi:autotransporter-associated beta strand protein
VSIGSLEGTGNVFLGANNLTVGGNGNSTTFSGVIQDQGLNGGIGGSLTKTGTGTLTLSGANTYTGGTTVDGASGNSTLAAGAENVFGTGAMTVSGYGHTATLDLNGHSQAVGPLAGDSAGVINLHSVNLTVDQTGTSTEFAGTIIGTGGSLTVTDSSGTGTLTLSGANTYTGGTTINSGTLVAGHNSALGTGAASITGGTLNVGTGVTVGNNITIGGSGTLSGTDSSSIVTGTVNGTGTIGGTLTFGSGGTLAPGNSPGILTNTGTLLLASGSIYAWQLAAFSTTGAGTNFDQIVNSGSITIDPGAILTPSFIDSATAPNDGDSFWNTAHNWTVIADNGGTIAGTYFTVDNSAWSGLGSFQTTFDGNALTLDWRVSEAVVPEPSTYAALLGGAALGFALWRRRKPDAQKPADPLPTP